MHTSIAIVSALLPLGTLAYEPNYLAWCTEAGEAPSCLDRVSKSCYDCIHPLETACPGDWDSAEFKGSFCPIPSNTWAGLKKCFGTGGACHESDETPVLNTLKTLCFGTKQKNYVCKPENQATDFLAVKMAPFICHGDTTIPPESSRPAPTRSVPAQTSGVNTGKPTAVPGTSTTGAPSLPTSTNKPGNQTNATTKPPVTAGAYSIQAGIQLPALLGLGLLSLYML